MISMFPHTIQLSSNNINITGGAKWFELYVQVHKDQIMKASVINNTCRICFIASEHERR